MIEIYFDGYCPESLLKGEHVEMRLNEDDFWESEATGLQLTVFPPFATILRWRGKGKFRPSSDVASNSLVGLVLTEARIEEGQEILPDEQIIINDNVELQFYLDEIYESKEKFDAAKFNPYDPVLKEQEQNLSTISKKDLRKLVFLFEAIKEGSNADIFMSSNVFHELHKMLYDLKVVFNFDWMHWDKGWKNMKDNSFDYTSCSLLDLSMYLTAILRADRFSDGTIKENFRNGTLEKIFHRLNSVIE
jgi:hypothetical protein